MSKFENGRIVEVDFDKAYNPVLAVILGRFDDFYGIILLDCCIYMGITMHKRKSIHLVNELSLTKFELLTKTSDPYILKTRSIDDISRGQDDD